MEDGHRRRSGTEDGPRPHILFRYDDNFHIEDVLDPLPPYINEEENTPHMISIPKAFFGISLLVFGIINLTTIETGFINETSTYEDIVKNAIFITDPNKIHPEHHGKLISVSGLLVIDEPLTSPDYGVSASVVYLKQRVQMYQWTEGKGSDGKIVYTKMWKDGLINSDRFLYPKHHNNPRKFPMRSNIAESNKVRIGAYFLSKSAKKEFTDFIPMTSDERPENKEIKLLSGIYYHTDDVGNPQVGDIRVQFSYAGQSDKKWTIVGKQVHDEIHAYQVGAQSILHLHEEVRPLGEVKSKKSHSSFEMNAKRLGIFGLIFLGMYLLIQSVYGDEIRQDAPQWMSAFNCLRLAFSLSSLLSCSVAGSLWLFYHQSYGIFLICSGFLPFIYIMIYFVNG